MVAAREDVTVPAEIRDELAGSGRCGLLERLHDEMEPFMGEVLQRAGMGLRRTRACGTTLRYKTVAQLARAGVALCGGLPVDLRGVVRESWGAALSDFIGSRSPKHRAAPHRSRCRHEAERIRPDQVVGRFVGGDVDQQVVAYQIVTDRA